MNLIFSPLCNFYIWGKDKAEYLDGPARFMHICLCYIAYALLNHCLLKTNRKNHKYSKNDLRRCLDKMQVSLVMEGKREFYLRARHEAGAADIAERLGLPALPNLIPKKLIDNYL